MAELKTKVSNKHPIEFLNSIEPEQKRLDAFALLEIFKKETGEKALMWGESIIGFGKYHYKSERSSQEGDWPLVGFSPRKQNLSLYIITKSIQNKKLLQKLGKYKTSKGCLYINKLSDVNLKVLSKIIKNTYLYNKKRLT